jgi:streptogramin lyase
VWVACYWSKELVRIDGRTLETVAHIALGPGPLDVSVGAGAVWATSRDRREIQRIDPSSNEIVSRVALAGEASPNSVVAVDDAVWVTVARCSHPPCF